VPAAASDAASPSAAASTGWERLPTAPIARLEMAVTAHEGRIWMAGGLSALGSALADVDILDPATGEWSEGPPLPTGLHHAALVSDGNRLLLIGGYLGSAFSEPTELVLVLDDEAGEWVAGPSMPQPRAAGAAAWDGSRVVYAGGVLAGGAIASDVIALTDGSWSAIGSMVGPREHLAATSDGEGRTWLMGGRLGGLDTNVATVEVVEGDAITLGPALATPRGGVAAFHASEVGACLTGGEAPDRAFTAVECVTADGTLVALPDLLEPHHGHGAAVLDGVAYVVLGGPEPTLSAGSTVEALDLAEQGR
jgi:non-specific serine/threonine protein kinase